MTPVLLGQFRLFYDQQKPIGVEFWGFVMSEACFQHDEVIAPFGPAGGGQGSMADEMVKDLKAKVFPSRELRVLAAEAGRIGVKVV